VSSALRTRRFKLRLGLPHIGDHAGAALVQVAGQLQRVRVVDHGPLQQRLLRVEAAQHEVIDRELRSQAQIEGLTRWTWGSPAQRGGGGEGVRAGNAPVTCRPSILSLRSELAIDYFMLRSLDTQQALLERTVVDYADALS